MCPNVEDRDQFMRKAEAILLTGAVAPLAIEIGAQTVNAFHEGLGFGAPIVGLLRGVVTYLEGGNLIGQGFTDLFYHPGHYDVLWNKLYGLSPNTAQTLSPAATAVKAVGYIAIPSLIGYSIDRGVHLFKDVNRTSRQGARKRAAS